MGLLILLASALSEVSLACLRDVTIFTERMKCVISVFTLTTWMPCFSAAQTLRGVLNVATRGIELASFTRTLTTLGRLKTSTITRVDVVNRS